MIYKFKRWIYVPAYTEVYITADTDKEALETLRTKLNFLSDADEFTLHV